jgi:hypothetical protein
MPHHQDQEQTLTEATTRPSECLDGVSNFTSVLMQEMFKISVAKPLLQAKFCSVEVIIYRLPFYHP